MLQAPPPPVAAPMWLAQPSPERIRHAAALFARSHTHAGRAQATCVVRADGRLDLCRLKAGPGLDPAFGPALLALAGDWRLDPAGAPPEATVQLDFPKLVDAEPRERQQPTRAQVEAANTAALHAAVSFRCKVSSEGALVGCEVARFITPAPAPEAEAAARRLLPLYRFDPARLDGLPVAFDRVVGVQLLAPGDTPPAWLKKPDLTQIRAAWPAAALEGGIREGVGRVRCRVTPSGAATACEIVGEEPAGSGFGGAALVLTPNFTFTPATHAGAPVEGDVTIPVRFAGGGGGFGLPSQTLRVMSWTPWERTPTIDDVARAYPPAQRARKAAGAVTFRCGVTAAGALSDCGVTQALPTGAGFEAAARKLLPLFRARMGETPPADLRGLRADLTIRFSAHALDPTAPFLLAEPDWTQGPDPELARTAFPAEARAAHVGAGRAVLDCGIAADGRLDGCAATSQTPQGLGFGLAAIRVAGAMHVNGWTRDGEPAAGARLHVPIRLVDDLRPSSPPQPAAPAG